MTVDDAPTHRVLRASSHGWYAGADRVVQTVETAIELQGAPSPIPNRLLATR
jgi:hypothetical protein